MAHLYAARSYDVAGKRDEALAQYKEVLARPNVYDAHDEAKKRLAAGLQGRAGSQTGRQNSNRHTEEVMLNAMTMVNE